MDICPKCNTVLGTVSAETLDGREVFNAKGCPSCGIIYAEDAAKADVADDVEVTFEKISEHPKSSLPGVRILKSGKVKVTWKSNNIDKNH